MASSGTTKPPTRSTRLIRVIIWAVCVVFGAAVLVVAPRALYVAVATPERRPLIRSVTLAFLQFASVVHAAAWLLLPSALLLLSLVIVMRRRKRRSCATLGRLALVSASCLIALLCVEGAAAVVRFRSGRPPDLPSRFPEPSDPGQLSIAVIGESSALGLPYDPWTSVGQIVAWKLEEVLPPRRVDVEMHAHGGICLEQAIIALRELKRKPDALLIYAGHNEFQARFGWSRNVRYYVDENPRSGRSEMEAWWLRTMPVAWMISEAIDRQMLDEPPPPNARRELVDHPAFRRAEYDFLLADFERRLDGVVAYAKSLGAVPILIAPAGNEADYPPFRSYLASENDATARSRFEADFRRVSELETSNPAAAFEGYERLAAAHPEFAEVHYRLGVLARRRGDLHAARRHFVTARDRDGMPMRCTSDFLDAIKRVASRHDVIVIDASTVLARSEPLDPASAPALLDDRLFHDPQHPNLRGYTAIAYAVLDALRLRGALGWPAGKSLPIESLESAHSAVARHFGMDSERWAEICRKTAVLCTRIATISHEPSLYFAYVDRLMAAQRAIQAGTPPAESGIPGIGVSAESTTPTTHTSATQSR